MSKEDSGKGGFEVLSASSAKTKKNKGGSLNDLFKCVESLANSTESLRDYAGSGVGDGESSEIKRYLDGLIRIQDGLLEMAQKKVRSFAEMPSGLDGIDLSDGKIGKD